MFFVPFVPTASAALVGIGVGTATLVAGYAFSSLITQMIKGAIYGALGALALSVFGFSLSTVLTAAAVGALVGVAVLAPLSFISGLSWIFPSNNSQDSGEDDELGAGMAIAGFSLRIGIIFASSVVVSTTLLLGVMPAAAIAAGAFVTELAVDAGKSVLGLSS